MSEFAESSPEEDSNRKMIGLSSLVLSNFHLFCSFILSHPLYFSFILFFSPYIFKILSFLSPLFVTTTLLLLTLLSTLHVHDTCPDSDESLETQPSFFVSFCSRLGSVLEPKFDVGDEGSKSLEELEAYKMVDEACSMEYNDMCLDELTFVDKFCSHESTMSEALNSETREKKLVEIQPLKFEVEKEETKKCENEDEDEEEQKVKPKSEVVLDNGEEPTKEESKAQKVDAVEKCNDESYDLPKLSNVLVEEKKNEVTKNQEEEHVVLESFRSMRKEKEWRRTLACKLFEERHNADAGQGMDQLWETYETQTEKKQIEEDEKKKKMMKKKKSMMMIKTKSIEKEEIVEVEDEDGIDHQQLCCLQALKFSTGKMHLGIAKPNLLKLSKAFKGFGRFYNANKHSKKALKGDE